jgi:Tol biopolymer transport system component
VPGSAGENLNFTQKENLMKKTYILPIIFTLILSGCSINITEAPTVSPSPQIGNNFSAFTPTPSLNSNTDQQNITVTPPFPTVNIPVTWADLNLTGRLVYINARQGNNGPLLSMNILDLVTGGITPIFQGPDVSWIYYVTISPDGKNLMMSYSAPPQDHNPINQDLYIMPLDGSQPPQLFIEPPTQYDQYLQAEWSPDGNYIYYVHNNYQNQPIGQHYPIYEIYRLAYPTGQPEKVADQAFWPRLSPDGSRLVYISMDPTTGKNKIFLANADGSNAQEVGLSGVWTPDIIDAPIFSPDGQSIIFSALSPPQTSAPSWIEKLFGILVAEAHSIPSDWWSVPLAGGTATRLTSIRATGLFASVSPDKRYIASYSGNGLFVMNPDGTNLTLLIPDMGGIPGTVTWIP